MSGVFHEEVIGIACDGGQRAPDKSSDASQCLATQTAGEAIGRLDLGVGQRRGEQARRGDKGRPKACKLSGS